MKAKLQGGVTGLLLAAGITGHAQQLVCEQLLSTPGLEVRWPTACVAPNGEFIVTGAARPVGTATPGLATHTFVARLRATGCDTLWQRRLPHVATYYASSAVRADGRGIWLLTPDTVVANSLAPPFTGMRLWRLTAAGAVRRVVRPLPVSAREQVHSLLLAADGGVYAQVSNLRPQIGAPRNPGLLRFDSTGTVRWRRDYGYAINSFGGSLCPTPTGGLLLTGTVGVGANYGTHAKLLEAEPSRGDSVRGATLAWGPDVTEEWMASSNARPLETIALTGGGYLIPSVVHAPTAQSPEMGQLTRVDGNYGVVWRYRLPTAATSADSREFMQVRELADGTLVALVQPLAPGRTFWLYRFTAATGALLAIYPFTSSFSTLEVTPAHLLPVAGDSTLLVVGGTRVNNTNQLTGIYVARVRVPGLPRVVTPAVPLAARSAAAIRAFDLYPNPAREAVTVHLAARPGPGRLELRDALGRLVRTQAVGPGAQPVQWSLAGLAAGLYAVVLREASGTRVQRLAVN